MFKKTGEQFRDSTLGHLYDRVEPVQCKYYENFATIFARKHSDENDVIVSVSNGWEDKAIGDGFYAYAYLPVLELL